jgi:hypothetical protein
VGADGGIENHLLDDRVDLERRDRLVDDFLFGGLLLSFLEIIKRPLTAS